MVGNKRCFLSSTKPLPQLEAGPLSSLSGAYIWNPRGRIGTVASL